MGRQAGAIILGAIVLGKRRGRQKMKQEDVKREDTKYENAKVAMQSVIHPVGEALARWAAETADAQKLSCMKKTQA